jgi:hypothetical protein
MIIFLCPHLNVRLRRDILLLEYDWLYYGQVSLPLGRQGGSSNSSKENDSILVQLGWCNEGRGAPGTMENRGHVHYKQVLFRT